MHNLRIAQKQFKMFNFQNVYILLFAMQSNPICAVKLLNSLLVQSTLLKHSRQFVVVTFTLKESINNKVEGSYLKMHAATFAKLPLNRHVRPDAVPAETDWTWAPMRSGWLSTASIRSIPETTPVDRSRHRTSSRLPSSWIWDVSTVRDECTLKVIISVIFFRARPHTEQRFW